MARLKNVDWQLPDGTMNSSGGTDHNMDIVLAALLMDIRDELKTLNRVFHCGNFMDIPKKLDRIERNTLRVKRKRK